MGKRAAIYTRVSRDAEGEAVAVSRQEADCRTLAERHDLDVVGIFTDNDLGASERTHKSKVRHQFADMIERTRQGEFDVIVAYSNSRLTRRLGELRVLHDLNRETGVQFKTVVSGDMDLSTADGLMIANIVGAVDAAESDRISERAKSAHRARALSGKVKRQHQRAFGWHDDGVAIKKDEAEVIRQGVADLARGMSIETIRARWMEQGIKTASGGTDWSWTTVNRVLLGWRTVGVRTYHREPLRDTDGEFIRGEWEAIISFAERDAALAQTAKRKIVKRRHGVYLLSSLVRCRECGGLMYGAAAQASRPAMYVCKNGSGHVAIVQDKLEWIVVTEFYAHLLNRMIRGEAQRTEVVEREAWSGEYRLAEVSGKIDELMDAFNSGRLSGSIVFAQVEKLEVERNILHADRERHMARTVEIPRSIRSGEDMAAVVHEGEHRDFAERQLDLRAEIDGIFVSKGKRGIAAQGKNAVQDRIEIVWKNPLLPSTTDEQSS